MAFVRDAVKTVGASVVRVDCEREVPPMQVSTQVIAGSRGWLFLYVVGV